MRFFVISLFLILATMSFLEAQQNEPRRQPLSAEKILEPLRKEFAECKQVSIVAQANLDIELDYTKQLQARIAQLEKEKSALEGEIAELKSAPGGVVKP